MPGCDAVMLGPLLPWRGWRGMSLHPLHAGTGPFLLSPLPLPPLPVTDHGAEEPGYLHLCTLCPSSPGPPHAVSPQLAQALRGDGRHRDVSELRCSPPFSSRDASEPGPLSQVCAAGLVSHAGPLSSKRTSLSL